jgi:hypothetical protein
VLFSLEQYSQALHEMTVTQVKEVIMDPTIMMATEGPTEVVGMEAVMDLTIKEVHINKADLMDMDIRKFFVLNLMLQRMVKLMSVDCIQEMELPIHVMMDIIYKEVQLELVKLMVNGLEVNQVALLSIVVILMILTKDGSTLVLILY